MDIGEVLALHAKSKEKVNLAYLRPSGKEGHCYIDPSKPLKFKKTPDSYGSEHVEVDNDGLVGVYKQLNDAEIWVPIKKLYLQNKSKAATVRILYGDK